MTQQTQEERKTSVPNKSDVAVIVKRPTTTHYITKNGYVTIKDKEGHIISFTELQWSYMRTIEKQYKKRFPRYLRRIAYIHTFGTETPVEEVD